MKITPKTRYDDVFERGSARLDAAAGVDPETGEVLGFCAELRAAEAASSEVLAYVDESGGLSDDDLVIQARRMKEARDSASRQLKLIEQELRVRHQGLLEADGSVRLGRGREVWLFVRSPSYDSARLAACVDELRSARDEALSRGASTAALDEDLKLFRPTWAVDQRKLKTARKTPAQAQLVEEIDRATKPRTYSLGRWKGWE